MVEDQITSRDLSFIFPEEHKKRVFVPNEDIGNDWTKLDYNDSSWLEVEGGGVGFSRSITDLLNQYIVVDLEEQMYGSRSSAYIRIPFSVSNLSGDDDLILGVRADDGFVAYLNGHEVASLNDPEPLVWDSKATQSVPDSEAIKIREFSLNDHIDKLVEGENLLAIHALNLSARGSDFLFSCQLGGSRKEALILRDYPRTGPSQFYRVLRK